LITGFRDRGKSDIRIDFERAGFSLGRLETS